MPKRHNCQARQYGDQMICAPCWLNWDANDPEPPECRKNIKRAIARVAKIEADMLPVMPHRYGQGRLPDELPPDLAVEMVKTYQANAGGLSGMRAAYRLFLDRVEL
jgi:hypothetical protein